jgi:N-acetylglucosamine-6-sulfatase
MLTIGYKAVRNDRYKYIRYNELEEMDELYDLQQDPYELKNIINDSGSQLIRREMSDDLTRLLNEKP